MMKNNLLATLVRQERCYPILRNLLEDKHMAAELSTKALWMVAKEQDDISEDAAYRLAKRFLKTLEKAGYGRYVVGRHGKLSRLVLTEDPRPVFSSLLQAQESNLKAAAPIEYELEDANMDSVGANNTEVSGLLLKRLNLKLEQQLGRIKDAVAAGNWLEAATTAEWLGGFLTAAAESQQLH